MIIVSGRCGGRSLSPDTMILLRGRTIRQTRARSGEPLARLVRTAGGARTAVIDSARAARPRLLMPRPACPPGVPARPARCSTPPGAATGGRAGEQPRFGTRCEPAMAAVGPLVQSRGTVRPFVQSRETVRPRWQRLRYARTGCGGRGWTATRRRIRAWPHAGEGRDLRRHPDPPGHAARTACATAPAGLLSRHNI